MKKIILLVGIFILVLIGIFLFMFYKTNNKDNNLETIKLAEVTHSPFYTPLYVAIEKKYFEDEGLKIDLILTSGANNVVAAVLSGDVNIGFCGPEATIYVYNEGEKDYVQTFAGLTKRDGQFIVSRNKIESFTYQDLIGKEVIGGRAGGMPVLNFINSLKNTNTNNVKVNMNVDFANLSSAFISGQGDFVNLFEPNATKLEKLGYGYVVASIGQYAGEVPYTAFNARLSYIKNNKDVITKFRNALNKGLEYTYNNNSKILAQLVLPQFPDTALNDLEIIIERYKNADSWFKDTIIPEDTFNNLQKMIKDEKLIDNYVPYKDLILNE